GAAPGAYLALAAVSSLATVVVFTGSGLYNRWSDIPRHQHVQQLTLGWIVMLTLLLVAGEAAKLSAAFSRVVVFSWAGLSLCLLVGIHLGMVSALWAWQRTRQGAFSAVVVGGGDLGARLLSALAANPATGIAVQGYFDRAPAGALGGVEYLGASADVPAFVEHRRIDRVYVALPLGEEAELQELLLALHALPCSVYLVPNLFVFGLLDAQI